MRAIRLEAVRDPDAAIAFLESPEDVEARDEAFWRERAWRGAQASDIAQYVAVEGAEWVGSLTVVLRRPGASDHLARVVEAPRADVVGVYVRPSHRGDGTIDRLLDAAVRWAVEAGATTLSLDVHTDNARAQGAYRRAGFVATGETFPGPNGEEISMSRPVGPTDVAR